MSVEMSLTIIAIGVLLWICVVVPANIIATLALRKTQKEARKTMGSWGKDI